MLKIEYKLTLQDELNGINAEKEYILNLPLLRQQNISIILFLILVVLNLPDIWKCFTSNVPFYVDLESPDTSIVGTLFNLTFSFLIIPEIIVRLPTGEFVQKYKIKRSLKKNPNLVKSRKIILTETNFVFINEKSEKSWLGEKLASFFENDTGFILDFGTHRRFIPKHIFINEEQINEFKAILNNYNKKNKLYNS